MSHRNYLFRLQLEDLSLIQVGAICFSQAFSPSKRISDWGNRNLAGSFHQWAALWTLACLCEVDIPFFNNWLAFPSVFPALGFLAVSVGPLHPEPDSALHAASKSGSGRGRDWSGLLPAVITLLWNSLISYFCSSLHKFEYGAESYVQKRINNTRYKWHLSASVIAVWMSLTPVCWDAYFLVGLNCKCLLSPSSSLLERCDNGSLLQKRVVAQCSSLLRFWSYLWAILQSLGCAQFRKYPSTNMNISLLFSALRSGWKDYVIFFFLYCWYLWIGSSKDRFSC